MTRTHTYDTLVDLLNATAAMGMRDGFAGFTAARDELAQALLGFEEFGDRRMALFFADLHVQSVIRLMAAAVDPDGADFAAAKKDADAAVSAILTVCGLTIGEY